MRSRPLRLALVPWMVAGVQTQYVHLKPHLAAHGVEALAFEVRPYVEGGFLERLPLPPRTRGTARSVATLLPLLAMARVDAVWSQVSLPLLPFAVTRAAAGRIPILFAVDSTPALYSEFGRHYGVKDRTSPKARLTLACLRLFYRKCAALLPWSAWVARSMVGDYHVPPERVHVVPPGIDVERWRPASRAREDGAVRLLFVGGDFERKGGPLLLEVYRAHLRERCELHLVTRAAIAPEAGVHVHAGLLPEDPELLALYQRADVMVLPTFADCFSMAALEAMACGLPVVISAVGGIPEIVADGETGRLVPPGDGRALLDALRPLVEDPGRRRAWGSAARARAAERFDAGRQARRVVEIAEGAIAGTRAG